MAFFLFEVFLHFRFFTAQGINNTNARPQEAHSTMPKKSVQKLTDQVVTRSKSKKGANLLPALFTKFKKEKDHLAAIEKPKAKVDEFLHFLR